LNEGLSEAEIRHRLQGRVPEFNISPEPGGPWNWLLAFLALAVASTALILVARHAVARRLPAQAPVADEYDEDEHWQDRLEDELLDSRD